MTLNTHSLMEDEYDKKLDIFVNAIEKHLPDVIALQEIMQPTQNPKAIFDCINCGSIALKEGNHALNIVKKLLKKGIKYNFAWLGIKRSYSKFDEGVVMLTLGKILDTNVICLSPFDDYNNWKTRKALGVKIEKNWYYSVHMGWWNDVDSPFRYELNNLISGSYSHKNVWFMGDFNSIAGERGTGYDLMINSGLIDTYNLAVNKDNGITANKNIDGWKTGAYRDEIRIDYIFVKQKVPVESSFVIFNGINEDKISDHNGILVNA